MGKSTDKQRFSLSQSTGSTITEIWTEVDPSLIASVLDAVTKAGVGITFAPTRSKNALSVMILDNGTRTQAYAEDASELATILETIQLQASIL